MARCRLGLLAPEFPPMLGGMAELARGLADALGAFADVRIFALPTREPRPGNAEITPLTGRPAVDAPRLVALEGEIDVWLAMNAGLVPLGPRLTRPFFAYWHGNDFLNPWLACGPRWLESFRRPYCAGPRHALRRRAIRRSLGAVRHLFTNSAGTRQLIAVHYPGLPPERVSVCPPGVDGAFFQESDPLPPSPTLRLLTVSRLSVHTRRKNVDGVLEALALVGSSLPWRYTVVGDGDDKARLVARAAELGLADRVVFVGSVDKAALLAAYRQTDLFILASKATPQDVEGFGIVYIEAAASGVPSICSRQGGAIDAVLDRETGLLIDDSAPATIAAAIQLFATNRQLFQGERLRRFAERFRWPQIAASLFQTLEEHR